MQSLVSKGSVKNPAKRSKASTSDSGLIWNLSNLRETRLESLRVGHVVGKIAGGVRIRHATVLLDELMIFAFLWILGCASEEHMLQEMGQARKIFPGHGLWGYQFEIRPLVAHTHVHTQGGTRLRSGPMRESVTSTMFLKHWSLQQEPVLLILKCLEMQ